VLFITCYIKPKLGLSFLSYPSRRSRRCICAIQSSFFYCLSAWIDFFSVFIIAAHLPDWICLTVGWSPNRLLDRAATFSCWCRPAPTAVVVHLIVEVGGWPLVAVVSLRWWPLFRSGLNLLPHRCGHRSCCD
jgi:hypothetical protein